MQVEEHIQQSDGLHTYLAVKFPIYDDTGAISGVCGILNDITAVKKAQTQLRRLSGSIMANQEKERSAIARELHDELGQSLSLLKVQLGAVKRKLRPDQTELGETLQEAAERELAMAVGAATCIQAFWRSYKVRKALKSKKKKKGGKKKGKK